MRKKTSPAKTKRSAKPEPATLPADATLLMAERQSFDLIVIGSGPAGQKAALSAAKMGKRVALVDRNTMMGGVCIHTGTIPSKAIREAVLHFTGVKYRDLYGSDYTVKDRITMDDLLQRAKVVSLAEASHIRQQMRRGNVHHIDGLASFLDPNTLVVTNGDQRHHIRGERILIAVGTNPARPANVPFTHGKVIDSNEILQMREMPSDLCVVGGGVIGCEYAAMFAACGVRVTLVDRANHLLGFLDEEVGESLQYRLRQMGVRLKLGEGVKDISIAPGPGMREDDDMVDGRGPVKLTLDSGKEIGCDVLLYSVGRQGATDGLDLENAGLTADKRGRLSVNENLQTDAGHIYAAGDVIGFPALAATSMEQGRRAAEHMFAPELLAQSNQTASEIIPYGIYTIPEISMIGETERSLTEKNVPFEVGIARYHEVARCQLMSDTHGMIKLIFSPDDRRLLGVHAIGTQATEIIHIGQIAMAAKLPIDYFIDAVFNYPTLAESYKVAATDGLNRLKLNKSASDGLERAKTLKMPEQQSTRRAA